MIVTIQFRRFKQRETTYNRVIAPKKKTKNFYRRTNQGEGERD